MQSLREIGADVPGGERQVRSVRRRHVIAAMLALLLALVAAVLLVQKADEQATPTAPAAVHHPGM
ncbi:hypothetical protein P5P86_10145 [Nocardioides sp. BP30]|uniref:hypothetical protein n=1 Tax=Nocardioides sp. BP30 TaxID=3036374 RepID=UPI00246832F4|nr:hypothetical protein [Nocardioides sp. BP30]WGL50332.1 hypothetical protein P5P86_10145 [Nocardioides sp. BP30]